MGFLNEALTALGLREEKTELEEKYILTNFDKHFEINNKNGGLVQKISSELDRVKEKSKGIVVLPTIPVNLWVHQVFHKTKKDRVDELQQRLSNLHRIDTQEGIMIDGPASLDVAVKLTYLQVYNNGYPDRKLELEGFGFEAFAVDSVLGELTGFCAGLESSSGTQFTGQLIHKSSGLYLNKQTRKLHLDIAKISLGLDGGDNIGAYMGAVYGSLKTAEWIVNKYELGLVNIENFLNELKNRSN